MTDAQIAIDATRIELRFRARIVTGSGSGLFALRARMAWCVFTRLLLSKAVLEYRSSGARRLGCTRRRTAFLRGVDGPEQWKLVIPMQLPLPEGASRPKSPLATSRDPVQTASLGQFGSRLPFQSGVQRQRRVLLGHDGGNPRVRHATCAGGRREARCGQRHTSKQHAYALKYGPTFAKRSRILRR